MALTLAEAEKVIGDLDAEKQKTVRLIELLTEKARLITGQEEEQIKEMLENQNYYIREAIGVLIR